MGVQKLYYLAGTALPTEKAHGLQIMKTCAALAGQALSAQGLEVTLLAPKRGVKDLWAYYQMPATFAVEWAPFKLAPQLGRFGYWWGAWRFAWWARRKIKQTGPDLILVRDPLPALLASFSGRPVFWESHEPKNNWLFRLVAKRATGIVAISGGIKNFLTERLAVPAEKISVVPDAADVEAIQALADDKNIWRQKLKLALDKKIVLYTGHLYDWKGADTLARAAKLLPSDVLVVLVGGTTEAIADFQARFGAISNLLLVGHQPAVDIPAWLKASDVLVLPNSGKQLISSTFTSPLKLFEYLAAGRAIVASDLPSLREILTDDNCFFVRADDEVALAQGILAVLANPVLAATKAGKAAALAKNFSWTKRAEKLIKIFND